MTTYEQLLADCIRWAKEAGRIQLELFRSDRLDIEAKFNDSDVVTNADKASEKAIISEIRRAYPEHSVLSEEAGCDKRMNDWLWVIDPLDGTTNYSSGLPNFCVSIGVQHKGQTVVGVVYAPYLGEIFTAVRGKGAFLNNRPIRCSTKTDIHKAVVSTGFPVDKDRTTDCTVHHLEQTIKHI